MIYIKSNPIYKTFSLIFLFLFIISCNNKKDLTRDELFKTILIDSIKYTKDIKAIIILEDKGCIKCQFALSDFIKNQSKNNDLLFLIQNDEKVIDLSDLKDYGNNVVFEDKRYLYNYNIINESSAILLDNDKNIDTIISLNKSNELRESLLFLNEKFN